MQIGRATVETSMNVPQKLKIIKLLCNAAISFLGIYLNKMKMLTQKKNATPWSFTRAKIWK